MRFKISQIGLTAVILIGFLSCKNEPTFSPIPKIEFVSSESFTITDLNLQKISDSVSVVIQFEDGDGDLGITEEESNQPPYNPNFISNYLVRLFKKTGNDQFEELVFAELDSRFSPLFNGNEKAPISGTLRRSILLDYGALGLVPGDLVKMEIQINDRNLNFSNFIETSVFEIGTGQ